MYAATDFFDLRDFAQADLFAADEPVWTVLTRIGPYLIANLSPANHGDVHPQAYLMSDDVFIGEGVVIEPGAYIGGPTYLGPGTVVRHGAYIRGNVITGRNCLIGHDTEVKNAIMLNGAQAPHYNYVGDSVLGAKVNLGAGARLANFKLQGNEIIVRHGAEAIPTGLRKFGAILGDGVSIGCNVVCNPGTLLGPRCQVYPLVRVRGYHPAEQILKA